ncbi:MAG: hypothetical protein ABFQ62_04700 [Patescibacteria group bacterium]
MNKLQQQVSETMSSLLKQENISSDNHHKDIESYIYQRLTSKKFRKTKLDENCIKRTKQAIKIKLKENKPIKIIFPQGGYKLWRLPSAPEADWAEFFNIAYLIEYLLPIAQNYKPGVELVYYMHTLLMELHDNLPEDEIQAYIDSFQKLIDEFQKYLPSNFKISILKDADIYSREEYFEKLEEGKVEAEKQYKTWDEAKKQRYLKMSELNIKLDGKEDWSFLSEEEKQNKLYLAALYETAATSNLEKVFKLVKAPENILVFTKATPDFIGIGSTRNSMAKYWVGFGVLETNSKGKLKPRVLTPSQYKAAIKQPYEKIKSDLISGKNFEEVLVFEKPFNFRK